MGPGRSPSQNSPAPPTPSSFGLVDLYRTPVQTIIKVEDEFMEEGQTADTRQSIPDSMDMDIGIPRIPSD